MLFTSGCTALDELRRIASQLDAALKIRASAIASGTVDRV
jgi:hypothetical protein